MNAIFITVFHQEKYVDMVLLLLESILKYGEIEETHILIYTSTSFKNRIMESPFYVDCIRFETNDHYHTIGKACGARLDLFNIDISSYEKILYLDTDILIHGPLQKVFEACSQEKLYVLEEGSPRDPSEFFSTFWGKSLFGSEGLPETAFTSGIMLFPNCEKIRDLFEEIKKDIIRRPLIYESGFYDQPYIIYQAFKKRLVENQMLKKYAVNGDENVRSDKVIHHFPGGPGVYAPKLEIMERFLKNSSIKKVIQY